MIGRRGDGVMRRLRKTRKSGHQGIRKSKDQEIGGEGIKSYSIIQGFSAQPQRFPVLISLIEKVCHQISLQVHRIP